MNKYLIISLIMFSIGCNSNSIVNTYSIKGVVKEVLYYHPGGFSISEKGKYLVVWSDGSEEIWSTGLCMVSGETVYKPCEEYVDGSIKCYDNRTFAGQVFGNKYTKIK